MPSRRDQIRMTDDELREFLAEHKVMTVATTGPTGRPHLMPLWYVPQDCGELIGWTFAKSQKAKNLERDPRATVQVEDGVEYQELRGVMLECDVELESDTDRVTDVGMAIFERYAPPAGGDGNGGLPPEGRGVVGKEGPERGGGRVRSARTGSLGHRQPGGAD